MSLDARVTRAFDREENMIVRVKEAAPAVFLNDTFAYNVARERYELPADTPAEGVIGILLAMRRVKQGSKGMPSVKTSYWLDVEFRGTNQDGIWSFPSYMVDVLDQLDFTWIAVDDYFATGAQLGYSRSKKVVMNGKAGSIIINSRGGAWVRFEEDVGGCSLDGQYPRGTIVFLSDEKISELAKNKPEESKKEEKKPKANYRKKNKRSE